MEHFRPYPPCAALRPYVRLLAIQEAAASQTYPVLPDTALVMGFQYRGGLAYHGAGGRTALAPAGVTGIRTGYRLFENAPATGTVLVVFKAGGAAPFFRLPLHELFQQSVGLADLLPPAALADLPAALAAAATDAARLRLVEAFLLSQLRPAAPDRLVAGALGLIQASQGTVRLADLARQLGTSASPLEKRFRQAVGASPKKLAGIVRLSSAIAQYRPGLSGTELGYLAGFYDQAHFIHAFRAFAGQSPAAYFRNAALG